MVNKGGDVMVSGDFYAAAARYAAQYRDQTIVIKFGGSLVEKEDVLRNLMVQGITLKNFGARVILVHGGGNQIDEELLKAGIIKKTNEQYGVRDTDMPTLEITHRCLSDLNRQIVNIFHEEVNRLGADVSAIGLGGNDNRMITAESKFGDSRTGTIKRMDEHKLAHLADKNAVPILHSICQGLDGKCMNVNADEVAAAVAITLHAKRLILCSDIPGVLDKNKNKISTLYTNEIEDLIDDGTIYGRMIQKVRSAAEVANNPKVGGVVILDGADKQAIETELLTDAGAGTLIKRPVTYSKKPSIASEPTAP